MSEGILDSQVIAQIELTIHLIEQSEQSARYEIDSTDNVFGKFYRIWGGQQGINLLGTFYQTHAGNWIAQKSNATQCSCWLTDTQAIAAITA
ncbi:MAG: hypothetical protein RM022_013025 [Nostoc sp. EfeVER01]|uniref:hypothetical protein n=1 Tax=unclassified Nostoc TaxID=2593658 RepID=UPI002AD4CE2D|nr:MULTISPECIES: hypothetical protein [unclassified Nostoc]MDZ7947498.1 hypothetical protein [Nostoc sp. EfeVER01]MDZ7996064.1 hypothetical protein [Nostoc sp. EspVER01]